jgi:radical SAM/Cys-rich protein
VTSFPRHLERAGLPPLTHGATQTLQVNVGLTCNQACQHCHVESSPKRTETMPREVWERLLQLLEGSPQVGLVDITGGAPELHEALPHLVEGARALGRRVMVRSNLTVLLTPEGERFPAYFAEHGVELTCSLPCYLQDNVDTQRGRGVYEGSVRALQQLNGLGYGRGGDLKLRLVYNPVGPSLPPAQAGLEADYKRELRDRFGIEFDQLFCLANLPIARFREDLQRQGRLAEYEQLLVDHFNAATLPGLMCTHQVSVNWEGRVFDCDFNLAAGLPALQAGGAPRTVFDLETLELNGEQVRTASYCFGCTAGAGSSCGGALAQTGPAHTIGDGV